MISRARCQIATEYAFAISIAFMVSITSLVFIEQTISSYRIQEQKTQLELAGFDIAQQIQLMSIMQDGFSTTIHTPYMLVIANTSLTVVDAQGNEAFFSIPQVTGSVSNSTVRFTKVGQLYIS
jgi:hypothetical protein